MSSTIPLPPKREQLCTRYYSNKHTHLGGAMENQLLLPLAAGGTLPQTPTN